ncbi:MAG TPA: hypothetical protein VK123_08425, partial [Candidatus Limnocylindrales bacterium]|nr:hypothetical protein [Candidatus Limnocylindrales bacterium]
MSRRGKKRVSRGDEGRRAGRGEAGRPSGRAGTPGPGLARVEWGVAILLSVIVILLHIGFFTHAGPLWRDEVTSVDFAAMPSMSAIQEALPYDSFPLLSTMLLRGWIAVAGSGDQAVRAWGLVVGIALLGALWVTSRLLGCRTPMIALALFGLNALAIRATGSIRPYGVGMVFIVLALGLLWRAIAAPTRWRFVAAAGAAILSVQCMYPNAFLLFAMCLAGGVVALLAGKRGTAGAVVLVGVAAAASLLPYWPSIQVARGWSALNDSATTLSQLVRMLFEALESGNAVVRAYWIAMVVLSCAIAVSMMRSRTQYPQSPQSQRARADVALFSAIFIVTSVAVFLAALHATHLPTQPWYYIPLMAAIAPALDASVCAITRRTVQRIARVALAILIAMAALGGWRLVLERRTNVDLVASTLEKQAIPGDLILIDPWYLGVTFQRYYHGKTEWTTLPAIEDLRIHRYDLLKRKMASSDPIGPLLEKATRALQSGHRVWLVGGLPQPGANGSPPALPPAPRSIHGWQSRPYLESWGDQAANVLASHAERSERVLAAAPGVSP